MKRTDAFIWQVFRLQRDITLVMFFIGYHFLSWFLLMFTIKDNSIRLHLFIFSPIKYMYIKYIHHICTSTCAPILVSVQGFQPWFKTGITQHESVYLWFSGLDIILSGTFNLRGHFYLHGLNYIPAWISNHMPSKVWEQIIYSFPNFSVSNIEIWEWISNFIPHFIMNVITYPHWD